MEQLNIFGETTNIPVVNSKLLEYYPGFFDAGIKYSFKGAGKSNFQGD